MQIINPLAAPLAQSVAVSRQQSTDKSEQIRREQALRKNITSTPDSYEHQVESSEEVTPIHDSTCERSGQNSRQQKPPKDAEPQPSIDLVG